MTKLSGLIVAMNEDLLIEDALISLKQCCDEIVVALDKCTDGTKAIAEKYADVIIEGDNSIGWDIEGKRRNDGIAACNGEWILELDADERITPECAAEINETLPKTEDGYFLLPILNFVGRRCVKNGWGACFGVRRVKRIFKKGSKVWAMSRVHPDFDLKGPEHKLKHGFIHLVDDDLDDMVDRMQSYSNSMAKDLIDRVNKGEKLPPFWVVIRKGFTRFLKVYRKRQGYTEGPMGFYVATMTALFLITAYLKAGFATNSYQKGTYAYKLPDDMKTKAEKRAEHVQLKQKTKNLHS